MMLRKPFTLILISALLLAGCLGRYAKPPRVALSAVVWETLPEPLGGLLVRGGVLLAWGGEHLLLRGGKTRTLLKLPAVIHSAVRAREHTAVILAGGRFLVLDGQGRPCNGATGAELPEPVPVPVAADSAGFLFCGSKGGVYRIAAPDWRVKRIWQAGAGISAPPGHFPGGWAVPSFSRQLAFFTNGAVAPSRVLVLPAIPDSTPLFLKEFFYITSREPQLYRHDLVTGTVRQKNGLPLWVNEFMLLDGKLLGRFWRGGLFACEPGGRMKNIWRHPSAARLTLPLVDGFALYCGAADGVLRALFRYNGGLMGSLRLGQDPVLRPVRFGGMVLAACGTRIYRIRRTAQDDPVW